MEGNFSSSTSSYFPRQFESQLGPLKNKNGLINIVIRDLISVIEC